MKAAKGTQKQATSNQYIPFSAQLRKLIARQGNGRNDVSGNAHIVGVHIIAHLPKTPPTDRINAYKAHGRESDGAYDTNLLDGACDTEDALDGACDMEGAPDGIRNDTGGLTDGTCGTDGSSDGPRDTEGPSDGACDTDVAMDGSCDTDGTLDGACDAHGMMDGTCDTDGALHGTCDMDGGTEWASRRRRLAAWVFRHRSEEWMGLATQTVPWCLHHRRAIGRGLRH